MSVATASRPRPTVARLHVGPTRFRLLDTVVLLAAAVVVSQAPSSLVQARWVPNLEPVPMVALGGLLVGYLVERSRLAAPIGLPLGALLGVEAITWIFAQSAAEGTLTERVDWLGGRVGSWFDSIVSGGVSNDPLVFALAMAALAWLLGLLTAWLLFRDNSPWVAILFNGTALLMNLSYAPASLVGYVGSFAAAACILLAAHQLATRTELWRRADLRVSWPVVVNVLAGTILATAALVWVAWALPANLTSPAVASGWNHATQPWQGLETEFDRWFAALNSSDRNARGLSFGRTLAPRGSFDLGDTPVLQVRASGPLYLRATTADRYASQAITAGETTSTSFEPNTDLLAQDQIPEGRALLQAQIKILASRTGVAFAPDAPLRFSNSIEVDTRGDPNDIATVRLDQPVLQNQEYAVVSAISTATVQDLRAAGEDYPEWVRRRYLQLPRTLPRRVIDLAHSLTQGAPSAYDKASALETALRANFTYSTHVAPVPTDRDWVDYFLFDSKEGYCDYFATAMVVLLRAEGVPARVASGFAPGEFDPSTGISIVRENHAHSWVEAYFARFGWITFEPSAIRSVPPRVEEAPTPPPAATNPPTSSTDTSQLTAQELDELLNIRDGRGIDSSRPFLSTPAGIALLVVLGAVVVLLLGAGVLLVAWRQGLHGLAGYQLPYAQLVKLGRWSGALRPRVSDTPHELAEHLARHVPRARSAIDELTNAYVEGTYAAVPPARDPWPMWLAVRRTIVRGLLGRRFGRWFGDEVPRSSAAGEKAPDLVSE